MSLIKNDGISRHTYIHIAKMSSNAYPHQIDACYDVINNLKDRYVHLVIGQPQIGKTGVMAEIGKILHKDGWKVYYFTGMADNYWLRQTKSRVPVPLVDNVYHLPTIKDKLIRSIDKKTIIIFDEIQLASKNEQKLARLLHKYNLFNINRLREDTIRFVQFSATPDGILYDIMFLKSYMQIIKMATPNYYISCDNLTVHEYKRLVIREKSNDSNEVTVNLVNAIELKKFIKDTFTTPKYHFIRVSKHYNDDVELLTVFDDFDVLYADMNHSYDVLLKIETSPDKHTIVFVKEYYRASATFNYKQHIGVMYERYTNSPIDSIIIQGFLGRCCGYDKNSQKIHIFTNIESIERYKQFLQISSIEDIEKIEWNSGTLKVKEGNLSKIGKTINNKYEEDGVVIRVPKREPSSMYRVFDTYEEAFDFTKNGLKQFIPNTKMNGCRRKNPDSNGMYLSRIGRREPVVRSVDDILHTVEWAHGTRHHYTYHIGYNENNLPKHIIMFRPSVAT